MHKLEKIYWRDIGGITDSWLSTEEILVEAEKRYNEVCESVGWVVFENDDYIVLAATRDPSQDTWHDGSMIMKSVIILREKI
jgi:hypothetical protein